MRENVIYCDMLAHGSRIFEVLGMLDCLFVVYPFGRRKSKHASE